ncbi:MAG TPA: hypothetical protein VFU53_08835 [Burkholderiales bacterium]|nr:hypothetical protein [Burkholderiales bacterium]
MTRHAQRRRPNRRRNREDAARWAAELAARYAAASTPEARAAVLGALDLPYTLDEDTALALYGIQPALSSEFIQRHLPRGRRADDARLPWNRLMGQALGRADDALHFALYRMQAPPEEWARDTAELARRVSDAQALCDELERRHPQRWRPDIGPRLHALALERGQHMLPYLERHAAEVWSPRRRSGYEEMLELAQRRGWWVLWATLLVACAPPAQYDREVMTVVRDTRSDEAEIRQRLLVLAGVWAPLHAGRAPQRKPAARVLKEDTLLALYERFAHLLRGPFRAQLDPAANRPLSRLIDVVLERRDAELVDHFAARLGARLERSGAERMMQAAARLAEHLEAGAQSEAELGRRAALIVQRLPRLPRSLRQLLQRNPLARLLFERAGRECLHSRAVAGSLLQAAEPHVRAFAISALTADTPAAHEVLRQHLDAVLGALERPLPAPVRRRAIRALAGLPRDLVEAQRTVAWARGALEPKLDPELLALVGRQIAQHPSLRGSAEAPVVHRRAAAH